MIHARRAASRSTPRHRGQQSALIVAVVTLVDLVSKAYAVRSLPAVAPRTEGLQLRVVTNGGAAFGMGADHPAVVGVLALLGAAALCWWLRRATTAGERAAVAVSLGGALGNLLERLAHGAVTDWIHVWPYPATFNLADIAVRAGLVTAAVLRLFRHSVSHRRELQGAGHEARAAAGTLPACPDSAHPRTGPPRPVAATASAPSPHEPGRGDEAHDRRPG